MQEHSHVATTFLLPECSIKEYNIWQWIKEWSATCGRMPMGQDQECLFNWSTDLHSNTPLEYFLSLYDSLEETDNVMFLLTSYPPFLTVHSFQLIL